MTVFCQLLKPCILNPRQILCPTPGVEYIECEIFSDLTDCATIQLNTY